MQKSQEWQHPEGIDEVGQRLRRIVNLNHPAQINVKLIGGGENVRRFDNPLASPEGTNTPTIAE